MEASYPIFFLSYWIPYCVQFFEKKDLRVKPSATVRRTGFSNRPASTEILTSFMFISGDTRLPVQNHKK